MKNQSSILSFIVKFTCLLILFAIIRQFYLDICKFPFYSDELSLYEPFGVSDWLINYQGGFVRRGLAGEVLWRIYQLHPYSVIIAIIGICALSLVLLSLLCLWLFHRMGWPVWLLIFPMFLYFLSYGLYPGLLGCRRDSLILLLGFILFWRFKKYLVQGRGYVIVWVLSVLILLIYEGIFFSFFPFLVLYTWLYNKSAFSKTIAETVFLWWPVVVVMFAITLYHGNESAPGLIWQSWMPCFKAYPVCDSIPAIGEGPKYLVVDLADNHNMAFHDTWLSDFVGGVPVWPFNVYILVALYYLFTRMRSMAFFNDHCFQQSDCIQMSNVFLLQLLFTMPMLGFVANDWFRSVPYCCITSCFICYLFPDRDIMPRFLDKFSMRVQLFFERYKWLRSPWTYYVVLVTLPLFGEKAMLGGMFPFIPNDLKHRILEIFVG